MKVLLVHTDIQGGGIEKVVVLLASHLPADARAICYHPTNHPEPSQQLKQDLRARGVELFRAPCSPLSLRYLTWLRGLIKAWSPDIVHFHGALLGIVAGALRRLVPRPPVFVYSQHPRASTDAYWLRILGARGLFRFLDHIVCVSKAVEEDLLSIAGARLQGKTSVIYNGIDLEPFSSSVSSAQRTALRQQLGVAPDETVIGSVGLLWPPKGYKYLLYAFEKISADSAQPLRLVIVGDGVERRELEQLAAKLKINRHVSFLGWRSDVPELLGTFDIYVQPSLSEGLPVALLEASATGLPIVATAVGGVPELIIHGHSGLVVQPGDPEALAQALKDLLDNPRRASQMAAAARKRVSKEFSVQVMADRHLQLYQQLLMEATGSK